MKIKKLFLTAFATVVLLPALRVSANAQMNEQSAR